MERPLEKRYPVNAKDYKIYEEVGDGVSATVYRALCIPLDEIVAVKVLDLEKCNNDLDGIHREVQTLSLIDHPNVLRAHCSFTAGHNLWAGNILIDTDGAVKLADFGVSACMFDSGDRQRSRNTFVGTPCWMAPEVMHQLHGYDFKADIWSFGITALELAHGHAPFSKYPPMKVLLMTLQNSPPGLDYERIREMVATCLAKDPKKCPTSEKLLKHHFFKNARSYSYLARTILDGLAPLGERFRLLKTKEADLVQNKALYEDKEQLSQLKYIRGISAWNFNLEDLKSQAALQEYIRGISAWNFNLEDLKSQVALQEYIRGISAWNFNLEDLKSQAALQEYIRGIGAWNFNLEDLKSQAALIHEYDDILNAEDQEGSKKQRDMHDVVGLSPEKLVIPLLQLEGLSGLQDLESSLASFPIKPLQALKGYFDVVEDDEGANSPNQKGVTQLESEFITNSSRAMDQDVGRYEEMGIEDALEGPVVQRGCFKVTSADLSPKGPSNCSFSPATGGLTSPTSLNTTTSLFLPSLQSILQHNTLQREEIVRLIKYLEQHLFGDSAEEGSNDLSQIQPPSAREKVLQSQVLQQQQRYEMKAKTAGFLSSCTFYGLYFGFQHWEPF
ncbi:glucan endo-1,3-beta-glucosidase 13-like [Hibiscus syriacus]|uniref:Glucan endo-1,3-beta-glucosidase 13-like n=1 Tax=Hibiscus syriacus TaxID=106335 RepID=A0A6A2ZJZ7_HIBSY|nr:glucan endo-1,3-beta-glucosidase 13-like [Hibiscus syriacus]